MGGNYTKNYDKLSQLLSEKSYLGITADYLQYAMEIRKKMEYK